MKFASLAVTACAAAALAVAVPTVSAQAPGAWKTLFNGKDFTGWVVPAGGGGGRGGARAGGAAAAPGGQAAANAAPAGQAAAPPAQTAPPKAAPTSTDPAQRSWKIENGVITSVPVATSGQSSGSLTTVDKYKDFEFEFDYKLDEAPNTDCTPKLGPKPGRGGVIDPQANLSKDGACTFNSGVQFRTGYQLNLGRREAGEYVGVVVHRTIPGETIRANVDWLSSGDCGGKNHQYLEDCSQFPEIRKKNDWNHVRIMFKGDHLQVWLNDKQITDVMDAGVDQSEREAAVIYFQFPPAGEGGGFPGTIKYRAIRVREI